MRLLVVLFLVMTTGCLHWVSDMEVSRGVYEVQARGNAFTSLEDLRLAFHERALEICRQHGKEHYDFRLSADRVRDDPSYTARREYDGDVRVEKNLQFSRGVVTGYVTCLDGPPAM